MKIHILFLLVGLLNTGRLLGQQLPPAPAKYSPINDYASILNDKEEATLARLLNNYEKKTSTQIVVLTISTLGGKTIVSYSNELFNSWGIGQRDVGNGVLLCIAKNDRLMRIETGYGVEASLTDAFCANIIDEVMKPQFKNGRFAAGIELALGAIIEKLGGEFKAEIHRSHPLEDMGGKPGWVWLFVGLGAFLQALIGWYFHRKHDDGFRIVAISTLFFIFSIFVLAYAYEEPGAITVIYVPVGLTFICIAIYLLMLLPKSLGRMLLQLMRWLLVLVFSSIPGFIALSIALAIWDNTLFFMSVGIITTLIFFVLFVTNKIDMASGGSSGGGYSSSYGSSGSSSYSSYSDYSSSYSDSSSWGGGSSGGGGASGSW